MKDQLFNYIKAKTPTLLAVTDFKIKNEDDEDGPAGYDYEVKCVLDEHISGNRYRHVGRTCLVNISEFTAWVLKKETIKWL